jgi:hypothetical protein
VLGFAGVYFEMMLKGASASLWMRNIQMGITSIIGGFAAVYLSPVCFFFSCDVRCLKLCVSVDCRVTGSV